ncbi:hypothetical protein POX_c03768 [Penicillium oxalicum]|uniref:hypothetical protein n=1 Tax=Penicillium oxalicum TaxID=69781 RepID=UPI0020B6F0FD|nr:hypothetical protein POX_c03768 [Penicillium oxalicum]KAI2790917.1 hypothetical protein POX_c03768 [Penicillium oxalicum]
MPAMKGFLRSFSGSRRSSPSAGSEQDYRDDSPEAILLREMTAFCEANNNASQNQQGNEYVHLPRIVETAESSPAAAREAAQRIRKYLSTPNSTPNHVQYNAIMLMRILGDNPGHSFTRHFDAKFCSAIKDVLRSGRDLHVRHYLCEYLAYLEATRYQDDDLQLLLQVWAKKKAKAPRAFVERYSIPPGVQASNSLAHPHLFQPMRPAGSSRALPDAGELVARIEEARNSAKLLTQFVQITPSAELEDNDLIKEFIERCRSSAQNLQGYIHSTNPAPDENTLLTLIETNDEISVALSQQQRAMLRARKARGASNPTSNVHSPVSPGSDGIGSGGLGGQPTLSSDPVPIPTGHGSRCLERQSTPREEQPSAHSVSRPHATRKTLAQYEYNSADFEVQNPFADENAAGDSDAEKHHQKDSAMASTIAGNVQHPPTEHKR